MLKNKLISVAAIGFLSMSLIGCEINDQNVKVFIDEARVAMQSRVALNRGNLEALNTSGLLTDEMYNGFKKSIDQAESNIKSLAADEKSLKTLADATVEYLYNDSKSNRNTDTTTADYVTIMQGVWNNIIASSTYKDINRDDGLIYRRKINESDIVPIKIIDDTHANKLNEILNYEVYVLKSGDEIKNGFSDSKDISGASGSITLDGVKSAIKEITGQGKSGDINSNKFGILNGYFKPSGVTLYDYSIEENKPVKYSLDNNDHTLNRPGKDIVLRQTLTENKKNTTSADVMQIRLLEFDSDIIEKLTGTAGNVGRKYIVQRGDGNSKGRVYLLEYPVSYIAEITVDGNDYKSVYKKSDIIINLLDGSLYNTTGIKLKQNNGDYITTGTVDNPYLEGTSSFTIEENSKIKVRDDVEAESGVVLLRDYLELSYIPTVHMSEDLIAVGRKIRIVDKDGTESSTFAQYCTIDNKLDSSAVKITVQDLSDVNIGVGGSNTKLSFNGIIESDSNTLNNNDSKHTDKLETIYKSVITPTTRFAGDIVNYKDSQNLLSTDKIVMYGMTIDKNPFDTGLFSSWINNSDRSKNSMGWWVDWLAANNYNYALNGGSMENFFKGNYKFDMADQGYIILDLETISKIQNDYAKQNEEDNIKWLRTSFVLLGFTLIAYALVALGCWALDTNADIGIWTLEKISFGRWVAVKSADELPMYDSGEGKVYIDAKGIIIKAVLIMTIGIIIATVDIVVIVKGFIDIFGGIAQIIDKILFGNR